jgi:hypothetical protein
VATVLPLVGERRAHVLLQCPWHMLIPLPLPYVFGTQLEVNACQSQAHAQSKAHLRNADPELRLKAAAVCVMPYRTVPYQVRSCGYPQHPGSSCQAAGSLQRCCVCPAPCPLYPLYLRSQWPLGSACAACAACAAGSKAPEGQACACPPWATWALPGNV